MKLISSLLLSSSIAMGIVFGGSNLGIFGYPDHTCIKPSKPFGTDKFQWQMYISDIETMMSCINTYIDNGNNDISRIGEKADEAIADYNAVLREAKSPY